jgi:hypothetical protein
MTPNPHRGIVTGIVRYASGQPAENAGVEPQPTAFPPGPPDPLAGGLWELLRRTDADGLYRLDVPPATYTIMVHGTSPAGEEVWGQVAGITVSAGSQVTVDVTVTEQDS